MIGLGIILLRSSGRMRNVLVVGCTAVVSMLVLVSLTVALLPRYPHEAVFVVIADPGTRGGFVCATLLLVMPPLLLLHQAVRWGSAARERRLAGLRLAGATPVDLRRLGAVELGIPATAGAILGVGAFFALRALLAGSPSHGNGPGILDGLQGLIPMSVTPQWWAIALVVALVATIGALIGSTTTRQVVLSPHGVSRQRPRRTPRPWGLLLLLGALVLSTLLTKVSSQYSTALGCVVVALAVGGVLLLASWVAFQVGRRAARRAASTVRLLAGRRLVLDPRPAGRAAAGVGGIALVGGGAGAFGADLISGGQAADVSYTAPLLLVALCLLVGLAVVAGTIAVHAAESAVDGSRSNASLLALGCDLRDLEQIQQQEASMVTLPLAVGGVVLGTVAYSVPADTVSGPGLLLMLGVCLLVPALVWVAVRLGVRMARPLLVASAAPESLRAG